MDTDKAIVAFSQSEKIKAGIIWVSQLLNVLQGLPEGEKKGGEKFINAMINMIGQEINLAGKVSGIETWDEIEPFLDKAVLMINSGLANEATPHLSMALSKVTSVGQKSMSALKEKNLL
jgi:hypothetical protein